MKVLLLNGSVGKKSCTRTLLQYIEDLLIKEKVSTTFWDLRSRPLPIAAPEYHDHPDDNPDKNVSEFVKAVREADAVVLGSPLYYGSYSGALKNALDNLPTAAFMKKSIGLVSHSSNVRSCVKPCNDLRPVVRALRGYTTHAHIGTTDQDYSFKENKLQLTDVNIQLRAKKFTTELVALASVLRKMPTLMH